MIKNILQKLTLRQKIGQMFLLRDDTLYAMVSESELPEYLSRNPIGGIWATSKLKYQTNYVNFEAGQNGGSLSDLKSYIDYLNRHLPLPLLVGGDSEKGGFMGASEIAGPDAVAAANDDALTYQYAACMAKELSLGGINWRWSPITDLAHHNSSVCVNRVCSDNPDTVLRYAKAFIKGTQDNGIAATVKHFPGQDLNDTHDPHFSTSINHASFADWMQLQGRVYKEAIDSGVYSVMVGHNVFPALDDHLIGQKRCPASFSKKIITDLLKHEWGFEGVVITDDIGMRAALSIYGLENKKDAYIELINAGNDMLLGSPIGKDHEDFIGYIEEAVTDGRISMERIDDACQRILTMKEKLGLFVQRDSLSGKAPSEAMLSTVNTLKKQTHEMNMAIARKSLTLLSNSCGLLPCDSTQLKHVSILPVTHSAEFTRHLEDLKQAFQRRNISATLYDNVEQCDLGKAAGKDCIIIYANFVSAHQPMGHCTFYGDVARQFFKILSLGSDRSVVISFGSPFIREEYYEEAETYINAYWYNKEVMEAVAEGILGEISFCGISPFKI